VKRLALLLSLVVTLVHAQGCAPAACAYGPSEIREESVSAGAGAELDTLIAFRAEDEGLFTAVTADDAPEGLMFTVEDAGVRMTGAVADAGTYAFTVLVEEVEGDVCAAWARYDVVLTVE
jgi:hypothetical protein